jgi:hypothetical protein
MGTYLICNCEPVLNLSMANQNLGIPNQNPIFLLVNGCSSHFFDPPKNMDENIGEYFLAPKENNFWGAS